MAKGLAWALRRSMLVVGMVVMVAVVIIRRD